MDSPATTEPPRKRRAINACTNCRTSKVRCDGKRPCQRCERNDAVCQFVHDVAKDEMTSRVAKLEAEVAILKNQLISRSNNSFQDNPIQSGIRITSHQNASRNEMSNAIDAGLITWDQAAFWFQSFFSESQFLVPIFCEKFDTMTSMTSRSSFLLDAIVCTGCRAEEGFESPIHRQLQSRVRDHLTQTLIDGNMPTIEDIQAITLMAAYSENGSVLIALALRFAMQLGLQNIVDRLMTCTASEDGVLSAEERELFRLSRIWHGICNLELFFSLDGGRLPRNTGQTSQRKIRYLIHHPERTAVDIRLLSQIELNIIRADAYQKIAQQDSGPLLTLDEGRLRSILGDTSVELSLWHQEWKGIVSSEPFPHRRSLAWQNLHIQHEWALMTLYLKAVAASGIENIDIMTDFQREIVCRSKEAAARHLRYILDGSQTSHASPSPSSPASTYLSTFKWTLHYVWAKCAFSVLLVLKLAILLHDPKSTVMLLLRDAHRVLEELKHVTVGRIAYFQILQTSIEKCEAALMEHSTSDPTAGRMDTGSAEDDFQGYAPDEFTFEWDFPGLNLKHMPLGWQDLFINIDNIS